LENIILKKGRNDLQKPLNSAILKKPKVLENICLREGATDLKKASNSKPMVRIMYNDIDIQLEQNSIAGFINIEYIVLG
jgi:hypothetical protein